MRAGRGRDAGRVAVRPVAAVRLRRHVPLRGRRAAGRAPGAGAVARLRAARRAARRAPSCASCSTPTRSPRSRPRSPGSPPTGTRAASTRVHDLLRAVGDLTHRRGDGPRRDRAGPRRAGGAAARDPGADRRRAALAGDRGRRPGARRARRRAAGRRARGVHRAGARPARRPGRRATPAPTGRSTPADVAARLGLGRRGRVASALAGWRRAGRLVQGEFRPGRRRRPSGATPRCCARSGAARWPRCAREVEPVPPGALARFMPAWQGVGAARARAASTACCARSSSWPGCRCRPARWRSLVLPRRVADYSPALLDELTLAGEVVWAGAGSLAGNDGWVGARARPSSRRCCCPPPERGRRALRPRACSTRSTAGAALFFRALADRVGAGRRPATDDAVGRARCGSWSGPGALTNDTLAPVRALLGRRPRPRTPAGRARRARGTAATPAGRLAGAAPRPPVAPPHGRPLVARCRARDLDPTRARAGRRRHAARPLRRGHPRARRGRADPRRVRRRSTRC